MKKFIYPFCTLLLSFFFSCERNEKLNSILNSAFSIESVEKGKVYPIKVYLQEDYSYITDTDVY